jgi:uncharacterized protein
MIPRFPEFKHIEISDKNEVESLTSKYPVYSDYNFVSLFSWDTEEEVELSLLNNNLVVKFTDYIDGHPFYSFIGAQEVDLTIETLLNHAATSNIDSRLKLIPEIVVKSLEHPDRYIIEEDRDNFDYIFSIEFLSNLEGNKSARRRNLINNYHKRYGHTTEVKKIDVLNKSTQAEIMRLFEDWEKQKKVPAEDSISEQKALRKLLAHAHHLNLSATGIYVDKKLVAFSINEPLSQDFSIGHFEKADLQYLGIFQYLNFHTVQHLLDEGAKYVNGEQDLGIQGLRSAKESMRPVDFLKKYTISFKR